MLAEKLEKPLEEIAEVRTDDLPPAVHEREALISVRVNQSFFRRRVLSAYNFRCCVTGLNMREFLVFNQELATLLKAGMPLVQSLDLLKGRVESPTFRRVLDDVYEKVRSGTALSDAFAAHGDLFPRRVQLADVRVAEGDE